MSLDYTCDKYENDAYAEELGECDTCGAGYETYSREGRCGDCGECAQHCDHLTRQD